MSQQQPARPAPTGQPYPGSAPQPGSAPYRGAGAYPGTAVPQSQQPFQARQPFQAQHQTLRAAPLQAQPLAPAAQTYGVAEPLEQNVSMGDGPQPSGLLVALGVFLLVLSIVVPGLLALLALAATDGTDADALWTIGAPSRPPS
ncbi:hypothetical protein C8046_17755 [Serinibacter arcticus]|uniref:Uncharacterized protein n=1 Tax=Serinibacter arcticus TaxID=1655435 RepID=A0A2U1ZZ65_9MICO|nr:hypothetical protein [Serinibacter arcticus]PWD52212.1 hypothetical protein C8046_17755 [Serinibacter arcticus]